MGQHFWLSEAQMVRIRPFFPKSRGPGRGSMTRCPLLGHASMPCPLLGHANMPCQATGNGQRPTANGLPSNRERGRVLSGIIYINRNGLIWSEGRTPLVRVIARTPPQSIGHPSPFTIAGRAGAATASSPASGWNCRLRCQETDTLMIAAEPVVRHWSESHWRGHLKAPRTASSLRVKRRAQCTTWAPDRADERPG